MFPAGTLRPAQAAAAAFSVLGARNATGGFVVSHRGNATVVATPNVPLDVLPAASVESKAFVFKVTGGAHV